MRMIKVQMKIIMNHNQKIRVKLTEKDPKNRK